jgi:cytoskeletal protein RodZ
MSQTSIGERLRQAREAIPASLTEASRATRVRVDFLEAMERDSFTFISGRVYVVGMLRSYARWLRLDDSDIAAEYDRIYGAAEAPALAESLATRNERSMPVQRPRKPHWAMAAAAAIAIIAVLLLFSLLGGGGNVAAPPPVTTSPSPAPTVSSPSPAPSPTPTATAAGFNGVQLLVSVTGTSSWMRVVAGNTTPQLVAFQGTMQQGVTRTFSAVDLLKLQIANLGAVRVSLNGKDLGPLGPAGQSGSYTVTKGDPSLTPDPSSTVPPPGQRYGPVVYPSRSPVSRPPPAPSPSPSPTPSQSPGGLYLP